MLNLEQESYIYVLYLLSIDYESLMDKINIYTDGSSRGNPGPGGFGAILMWGDKVKEISEAYRKTTNNRMELLAVIKAILALKTKELPVHIYTDSKYVVESVEKNGWIIGLKTISKEVKRIKIYGFNTIKWLPLFT